jgi:hypothetical protein
VIGAVARCGAAGRAAGSWSGFFSFLLLTSDLHGRFFSFSYALFFFFTDLSSFFLFIILFLLFFSFSFVFNRARDRVVVREMEARGCGGFEMAVNRRRCLGRERRQR